MMALRKSSQCQAFEIMFFLQPMGLWSAGVGTLPTLDEFGSGVEPSSKLMLPFQATAFSLVLVSFRCLCFMALSFLVGACFSSVLPLAAAGVYVGV